MALYEIPVESQGKDFRFETNLFGVRYHFYFHWIPLDQSWWFDMNDANGNPIVEGMRAILSYDVLAQVKDEERRTPPGYLFFLDTSGQYVPPGPNDLGSRVLMIYEDLAESLTVFDL